MWADGGEGEYGVVEPRGYDSGGLKKDGDEPGGSGGIHGGGNYCSNKSFGL